MKQNIFKISVIALLFLSLLTVNSIAQKPKPKPAKPEKTELSTKPANPEKAPENLNAKDQSTAQQVAEKPKVINDPDVLPKPAPKPVKEFIFPDYKTTTLSNGLKVYLIHDNEQPEITLHLMLAGGQNLDGGKPGLADLATSLMTKGAGKRNALEIAQKLDGIGAGVSASAGQDAISVTGSSLTSHFSEMFEIFADVVLSPKFPKDEFDKLLDQALAGVKMRKSNSGQIAALLATIATFGPEHPYAKFNTEASLKSITLDDIKNYYKSTFMPNNATLAVIGDFDEKELIKALESRFKNWTKGQLPKLDLPEPKPLVRGVYFVPRAGSKQSSVVISALTVPKNNPDFLPLRLTGAVMGGGFGSKLFRTLREKYSFTYSPFARQTSYKFANMFTAGSEVKNDKTDSSITVILDQFKALYEDNGVTEEELARIKSNVVGNFQMSFESSEFIASLIQNADFYNEPIENYKRYGQRINELTTFDIAKVSDKYLKRDRLYIAVVGLPELKDSLAKFGEVHEYSLDLESADDIAAATPVNIKPEELIEKFTQAIGGKDQINKISTVKVESKVTLKAQGQSLPGNSIQIIKFPDKEYSLMQTPVFKQEGWVFGQKAWRNVGAGVEEVSGDELKKATSSVGLFITEIPKFIEKGYKCEILGEKNGQIKFKYKDNDGDEATYYFDKKTFLPSKRVSTEQGPQGPIEIVEEFNNYENFNGIKFPMNITVSNPYYSIELNNNVYINQPVDDSTFEPKK
jgi:predicted Zn-dependent peptidase